MNTTEAKGSYNEQKGKLKQKFAALTDNSQLFEEGREEEVVGKRQTNLGKTKENLQKIIGTL